MERFGNKESMNSRLARLLSGKIEMTPMISRAREYQLAILGQTQRDIRSGELSGRWDVATGGGKTAMALSLAEHMVRKGARVLFVVPSNIGLENVIDEHRNLRLGENNFLKIRNVGDIDYIDQIPGTNYFYVTGQMLCYADRFEKIPKDFFDLVIFDEGHGFLGPVLSQLGEYFEGVNLYMTATPGNTRTHLDYIVPHVYGKVSSDELISNYGFPPWILKNYDVEEGDLSVFINGEDQDFDFRSERQMACLDMNKRFAICEQILMDTVPRGERTVLYMPSVDMARRFVETVASQNRNLRRRVAFVDGQMSKSQRLAVKRGLMLGAISAVACKDIWDESLNIPEITHLVFNDPTRSWRKIRQRIGRGARPAEGKEALFIHDIVSVTSSLQNPYMAPHTVAGNLNETEYGDEVPEDCGRILNGPRKGGLAKRGRGRSIKYVNTTKANYETLKLSEKMLEMGFMRDEEWALRVFKKFAEEVFCCSLMNLVMNFGAFRERDEKMVIRFLFL